VVGSTADLAHAQQVSCCVAVPCIYYLVLYLLFVIQKDRCLIPLHASEASSRLSNRIQIFIQRRSNVLGKGLSFREFGAMDSLDSLWQDRVERYVTLAAALVQLTNLAKTF